MTAPDVLVVLALIVLGVALYAVVTLTAASLIGRRLRHYRELEELFGGPATIIDFQAERRRRRREIELYDQEEDLSSPAAHPGGTLPPKERGAQ